MHSIHAVFAWRESIAAVRMNKAHTHTHAEWATVPSPLRPMCGKGNEKWTTSTGISCRLYI